jgi:transposase
MGDVFVGIDVSKSRLDVAVRPSGEMWQVGNDEAGFATLVGNLKPLAPKLVVRRRQLVDMIVAETNRLATH